MFEEIEKKARQMITDGHDEYAFTMWVDGHYVTVVVNVAGPDTQQADE
nr:hypothetical protein [uncultured Halomonas sp.]